jgi:phenylalanine-4-hydroxylase
VLDTHVQISGQLQDFIADESGLPIYLQFTGPSQLSHADVELPGQGAARHAHGYSCPVGTLRGRAEHLYEVKTPDELARLGLKNDQRCSLEYSSGVKVEGKKTAALFERGTLLVLTFSECKVSLGERVLFDPSWGEYDMAIGHKIVSVFGGPADRTRYGEIGDFANSRVPMRNLSVEEKMRKVRGLRLHF